MLMRSLSKLEALCVGSSLLIVAPLDFHDFGRDFRQQLAVVPVASSSIFSKKYGKRHRYFFSSTVQIIYSTEYILATLPLSPTPGQKRQQHLIFLG